MSLDATARPFVMAPASLAIAHAAPEETLVADARNGVRPAQMVERRLMFLLYGMPLSRNSGETFRPRCPLSYAGAQYQTQASRQRIMDPGANLGTPIAPAPRIPLHERPSFRENI